jgi:hypothetical protein
MSFSSIVMPAQAGIHVSMVRRCLMSLQTWTPAFAEVTSKEEVE